jgi:hypothetical protein
MKNKKILPKVSVETFVINGQSVKIKIVRDSKICRLLTDDEYVIIGHTIYVRGKLLIQRVIRNGLEEIAKTSLWKIRLLNLL